MAFCWIECNVLYSEHQSQKQNLRKSVKKREKNAPKKKKEEE